MKKIILKNKILTITLFLYLSVLIFNPTVFSKALSITWGFILEMLQVMIPIMVISSLITVWISREVIMKHFGQGSGIKGKGISLLIGAFSAGPIYAAFPMAKTLLDKGASIGNIVIIISSWAVIKVPMLLVEINFLGPAFAGTRYLLTIPFILLLGFVMDKALKYSDLSCDKNFGIAEKTEEIYERLPKVNCGLCAYKSCREMALAVYEGRAVLNECAVLKDGEKDGI